MYYFLVTITFKHRFVKYLFLFFYKIEIPITWAKYIFTSCFFTWFFSVFMWSIILCIFEFHIFWKNFSWDFNFDNVTIWSHGCVRNANNDFQQSLKKKNTTKEDSCKWFYWISTMNFVYSCDVFLFIRCILSQLVRFFLKKYAYY